MAEENQDAPKQGGQSRLIGSDARGSGGVKMLATDAKPETAQADVSAESNVQAGKVDGKVVSVEEWRKAASENGYDLARMPPNYFPDINTQK